MLLPRFISILSMYYDLFYIKQTKIRDKARICISLFILLFKMAFLYLALKPDIY